MKPSRVIPVLLLAVLLASVLMGCGQSSGKNPFPRWRGVNVHSSDLTPELIARIAGLGSNAIRVNLDIDKKWQPAPGQMGQGNPLDPYQVNLAGLDAVLPVCRERNIQVILCLSGVPGRKLDVFWNQSSDGQGYREKIVGTWHELAKRYRDEPALVAYDILNEPTYKPEEASVWWEDILPKSIAAIRESDQSAWLVIEPGPWGLPGGFANMPISKDPKTIYSFHHYLPHAYTHQGVSHLGNPQKMDTRGRWTYPGITPTFENDKDDKMWDREALEKSMQAVLDFQKSHPGVRILVGEFGVIRWAPGAEQWLRDSINIFEEHGWDWMFHSLGGWNGWDPAYQPDDPVNSSKGEAKGETPRLKVLREGWALNPP